MASFEQRIPLKYEMSRRESLGFQVMRSTWNNGTIKQFGGKSGLEIAFLTPIKTRE